MSFFKEFKEFAIKGNAMNMAIGVVIGGAFQGIVNSLVNDIIMPFTAIFTGSIDYSNWVIKVAGGAAEIGIGSFLNALTNFLIIALSIFVGLRYANKLNQKVEEIDKKVMKKIGKKSKKQAVEEVKEEPTVKTCPYCFSEIPYKATKCPHCTSSLTTYKV